MKQKWSAINHKANFKVETKNLTSKNFEWQRDSTGIKLSDLRKKKGKRRRFRKQKAKNRSYGNGSLNSGSTILFENGRVVSSKRKREFSGSSYNGSQSQFSSYLENNFPRHRQDLSYQQKASKKSKLSETESSSSELKRHRLTIPSIDIYRGGKDDVVSKFLGENRVCSDSEDVFTSDFIYNREIDDLYLDGPNSCHSNKIRAKVEADFDRQFRNAGHETKQCNQSTEGLLGSGTDGSVRGVTCVSSTDYVLQSPRIVQLKSGVPKYRKKSAHLFTGINCSKLESLSISVDMNNGSTSRKISGSHENMNRISRKRLRQISGCSSNRRDQSSESDSSSSSSESSSSSVNSGIRKKARHKSERSDESSDCRNTCNKDSFASSRARSSHSRNGSSSSYFSSNRNRKTSVRSSNKFDSRISSSRSSESNGKYPEGYSSDSSSSSYMSRSSETENRKSSSKQIKTLTSKEKIEVSANLKTTAGCPKKSGHQKRRPSKQRKSSGSEYKMSAIKMEHESSDSYHDDSSGSHLSQYKLHSSSSSPSSSSLSSSSSSLSSSSSGSSSSSSSSSSIESDSETKEVTDLLNRISDFHKSSNGYKCLLDQNDNKQDTNSNSSNIAAKSSRQLSNSTEVNTICNEDQIKKLNSNHRNNRVDEDQSIKWCNEFLERYKCLAKNIGDAPEKLNISQDSKSVTEKCTGGKTIQITKEGVDNSESSASVRQKSKFGNSYSYYVQASSDSETESSDFTDKDEYNDEVIEPSVTTVGTSTGSPPVSGYLFCDQTKQQRQEKECEEKDMNKENVSSDVNTAITSSSKSAVDCHAETGLKGEYPLRNIPKLKLGIDFSVPVFSSGLPLPNPEDTAIHASTSGLLLPNPQDTTDFASTSSCSLQVPKEDMSTQLSSMPALYRQALCSYSSSENELEEDKTDIDSQGGAETNTFMEKKYNSEERDEVFETETLVSETNEESHVDRKININSKESVKNMKEKPRIYNFYVYSESDSEDEQSHLDVKKGFTHCSNKKYELITRNNGDKSTGESNTRVDSDIITGYDKEELITKINGDNSTGNDKEELITKINGDNSTGNDKEELITKINGDNCTDIDKGKFITRINSDNCTINDKEELTTRINGDNIFNNVESATEVKIDNTRRKEGIENQVSRGDNNRNEERPQNEVFTCLKDKTSTSSSESKEKTPDDPLEVELRKFYLLLKLEHNLDNIRIVDDNVKYADKNENNEDLTPGSETKSGNNNLDLDTKPVLFDKPVEPFELNTKHVAFDKHVEPFELDTKPVELDIKNLEINSKYNLISNTMNESESLSRRNMNLVVESTTNLKAEKNVTVKVKTDTCESVNKISSQYNSEGADLNTEKCLTFSIEKESRYSENESCSQRDLKAKNLDIQNCLNKDYDSYGSETETYSYTADDNLHSESENVNFENPPVDKIDLHVKPIDKGQSSDFRTDAYIRVKPLNKRPESDLKCRAWLTSEKQPCLTTQMIDNSQGKDLREVITRARKASFDMNQNAEQDVNETDIQDSNCQQSNLNMEPCFSDLDRRNVVACSNSDCGERNVLACSSSGFDPFSKSDASNIDRMADKNIETKCDSDDKLLVAYPRHDNPNACSDLGMNNGGTYRSYDKQNSCSDLNMNNGGTYYSYGNKNSCSDLEMNNGGTYRSHDNQHSCSDLQINDGGTYRSYYNQNSCTDLEMNNGGTYRSFDNQNFCSDLNMNNGGTYYSYGNQNSCSDLEMNNGGTYRSYDNQNFCSDLNMNNGGTYYSYGNQNSCSDLKSNDNCSKDKTIMSSNISSDICLQSSSKDNAAVENLSQQNNGEIPVNRYDEVDNTQNRISQGNVSLKNLSVQGNCADLVSSGYSDISKIPSVTFSQEVANSSCKESGELDTLSEPPVYTSADVDQNKNNKVSDVTYHTEVTAEKQFKENKKNGTEIEKKEDEELHLVSEESIALSECKIDISSISPELMGIIMKKRTELEKNFTKDCQVFVSVCEFLLSKDPGLTEQLQTCMQKCLEDLSDSFAEAFQNFVQTTIDENQAKKN